MESQLLVDKAVIINERRWKTNISLAWIDFWQTYDMVPQSWIWKSIRFAGCAMNVIDQLKNSMKEFIGFFFWKNCITLCYQLHQWENFLSEPFLIGIYCDPDTIDNCIKKVKQSYLFGKKKLMANYLDILVIPRKLMTYSIWIYLGV